MEPTLKLDSHLIQALHEDPRPQGLFDVVIGLAKPDDAVLQAAYLRDARVYRLGPKTAKGTLTRAQLFKMAEQPAVRYLKLVEQLFPARG